MNKKQTIRMMLGAARGNSKDVQRLLEKGLKQHRQKAVNLRREVEYRRANEWDAQAARQAAMNGEVPAEQTLGAFADLHGALMQVLALTPASVIAPDDELEHLSEMWGDAIYRFVLMLHNPTIKYGIIGGFRPELREEIEQSLNEMGRETWGVILELTDDSETTVDDFPPRVSEDMKRLIEAQRQGRQI